jgi:adenylate cyclase
MGIEIERKYLVNSSKWEQVKKSSGEVDRQGYLLTDPNKTIRVRHTAEKAFFNNKRTFNWCNKGSLRI